MATSINMFVDDERRKKIGDANRGRKKPEGFGEMVSMRNRGRVVSEETKQKMRDAHALRKEGGAARKPRRKLTEEEKLAISERVKKDWQSLDRRFKHSLTFYNKRID